MKKLICVLFSLITLSVINQCFAQDCSTASFTVNAVPTESTCQSNGTVAVTLSGDLTNWVNIEYGLSTTGNPSGFSIQPNPNPTFYGVPPGTYDITVRAFCLQNNLVNVIKTATNVIVGGNYKVPQATFSSASSRKSYADCATGIIAINVEQGSGNFTFEIKQAPTGVNLGVVNTTKSGTIFALNGTNYPAGNYTIEIKDGTCYSTNLQFTLGSISGYPAFDYALNYFNVPSPYLSCSLVEWSLGSASKSNGDYYQYYTSGMYEVAMSVGTDNPNNWKTWNSSILNLDIAPRQYSDAYNTDMLKLHIRVKGCSNYQTFSSYLNHGVPTNQSVNSSDCDGFTYKIKSNKEYYAVFCYPYSVEIKDGTNLVWSTSGLTALSEVITSKLRYNKTYNYTVKDANGSVIYTNTLRNDIQPSSFYVVNKCDGYNFKFTPPSGCFPQNVIIKETNTGSVVFSGQVTSASSSPTNGIDLKYGVNYTLTAVGADNAIFNYTHTFSTTQPTYTIIADLYPKSPGKVPVCAEDYGYFSITVDTRFSTSLSSSSFSHQRFPLNTVIRVVDPSPASGYSNKNYTPGPGSYYNMPEVKLPAGTYYIEIDEGGCSNPKYLQVTYAGGYNVSQFSYTTDNSDLCKEGMKVYPTGNLKFKGSDVTSYFRLTAGPSGYDKNTVITSGDFFSLQKAGVYKIGIMAENSSVGCVYREVELNYNPIPLELNEFRTSSYVCDGEKIGHIMVTAKGGITPYTYELWDKTETNKLDNDIITSGEAHFIYGAAGETYKVVVRDCKNSFEQDVSMVDLSTAHILYTISPKNEFCEGSDIQLRCITLGSTSYKWTGPNGWTSSEQNPIISNAQVSATGKYKVAVTPEFCGKEMIDEISITVHKLPEAPIVGKPILNFCQNTLTKSLVEESEAKVFADGGNSESSLKLKWYASDGITEINPPSSINTTTLGTKIYYVSQINQSTGCEAGTKIKISVVVNPIPSFSINTAEIYPICPGEKLSIPIANIQPSGSYIYNIYDQAIGGQPLYSSTSNTPLSFLDFNGPNFSSTYYIEIKGTGTECASSRISVPIKVKATANVIVKDTSICPNTSAKLTVSNGSGVTNPIYKWYESQTSLNEFSIGNSYTTPIINQITHYYVSVIGSNFCENPVGERKMVTINMLGTNTEYSDIRILACPQNTINLSKYIDISDFVSIKWTAAPLNNVLVDNNGTLANASLLLQGNTYKYFYEIKNTCSSSSISTLYLSVPKKYDKKIDRGEIRICYEKATAIQLNQIFGIDGNGTWTCTPSAANNHLIISTTAPHIGAAILNGEAAWANNAISFDLNGNKVIRIIYTPAVGNCFEGNSYTATIILTNSIM